MDLGDGATASLPIMTAPRTTSHEQWSIVRGPAQQQQQQPSANFPAPVRMSTFRNQTADDDWAAAESNAPGSSATLSPRSQRRTRSSRAAATDVRVFI